MSPPFRSAVALRFDFCDTTDELKQRYSEPLPDGAVVYVTEADAIFRLSKSVGSVYDGLTQLVVIPADQSTNRWFKEAANGSSPWEAAMYSNPGVNVASPGAGQWNGLGTTAGTFLLGSGDPAAFVLNPTTSIITYQGPTRIFNLQYFLTVLGSPGPITIEGALSVNGDIAIGNTSTPYGKGVAGAAVTTSDRQSFSGQRSVIISRNDQIRIMVRNLTGSETMAVVYSNLLIRP